MVLQFDPRLNSAKELLELPCGDSLQSNMGSSIMTEPAAGMRL
jgi:hypothetical protein